MVTKKEWLEIEAAKELFCLAERATLADIKKAFRHLTKKFHPDLAGESEENRATTQKITEAYQALLAYCEGYEFPLVMAAAEVEDDEEEWWMNRFGGDSHWGPGRAKE